MSPPRFPSRLVFIGGGNMTEAILHGMVEEAGWPPRCLSVAEPRVERLEFLHARYGVEACADNAEAVRDAEAVVLAVKPQKVDEVLVSLAGALPSGCLVVSILAGVPTARLSALAGRNDVRFVRVMPNTPALVGEGMSAICAGEGASESDAREVADWMQAVGEVVLIPESHMDAVTAVSGSGPAYVFYLMEQLIRGAETCGLPPDQARSLVLQTVLGAARLALASEDSPATLRRQVTSPGGTTEAALKVLEAAGAGSSFVEAVCAARARAAELAEG